MIGGIIGSRTNNEFLTETSLLALVINGSNLLPILPLDGGWIAHAILFSRHHIFDLIFRLMAILALFAFAAKTGEWILLWPAIMMCLGISQQFKLAKLTTKLRRQGVRAVSPDDQNIPQDVALRLISEIRQILTKGQTIRTLAGRTVGMFETLNAVPPGWLVSTGLLLAQVLSFAVAVGFTFWLMAVQQGLTGSARSKLPAYLARWDKVRQEAGVEQQASISDTTVAASFKIGTNAAAAFSRLGTTASNRSGALLLGRVLVVSFPSERQSDLQRFTNDISSQVRKMLVEDSISKILWDFGIVTRSKEEAAALHTGSK